MTVILILVCQIICFVFKAYNLQGKISAFADSPFALVFLVLRLNRLCPKTGVKGEKMREILERNV